MQWPRPRERSSSTSSGTSDGLQLGGEVMRLNLLKSLAHGVLLRPCRRGLDAIARGDGLRDVGVGEVAVEADLAQTSRERRGVIPERRAVLDARRPKPSPRGSWSMCMPYRSRSQRQQLLDAQLARVEARRRRPAAGPRSGAAPRGDGCRGRSGAARSFVRPCAMSAPGRFFMSSESMHSVMYWRWNLPRSATSISM